MFRGFHEMYFTVRVPGCKKFKNPCFSKLHWVNKILLIWQFSKELSVVFFFLRVLDKNGFAHHWFTPMIVCCNVSKWPQEGATWEKMLFLRVQVRLHRADASAETGFSSLLSCWLHYRAITTWSTSTTSHFLELSSHLLFILLLQLFHPPSNIATLTVLHSSAGVNTLLLTSFCHFPFWKSLFYLIRLNAVFERPFGDYSKSKDCRAQEPDLLTKRC